jgi:glutaredoxin-like YruB-family protein
MSMKKLKSYKELSKVLQNNDKNFLLLYKSTGSEINNCAFMNISEIAKDSANTNIYSADVSLIKDIHIKYNINSVPVLMEFTDENLTSVYKGCNNIDFYKNIFRGTSANAKNTSKSINKPSVIVYSTPTCSWCNTLKTYLRKNNIIFRDIDVSKNEAEAKAMVQRSGQQGVPQSVINGQVVVGFDQNRINKLLNIN